MKEETEKRNFCQETGKGTKPSYSFVPEYFGFQTFPKQMKKEIPMQCVFTQGALLT